jgi:hypothetical protein
MNKADKNAWEQFDRDITIVNGSFPPACNLGNCSVAIRRIQHKLYLEIIPIESILTPDGVNGTIVVIDEKSTEDISFVSIMEMARQSKFVQEAKKKGEAILKYVL